MSVPPWAPRTVQAWSEEHQEDRVYEVVDVRPPESGDLYVRGLSDHNVVKAAHRDYPYRAPRLIVEVAT